MDDRPESVLLPRLAVATVLSALPALPADATTPFAASCEGNVCFQRKVQMGCLKPETRRLMSSIAQRFGMIEVASACDGRHARNSAHYVGKAFDFRPFGGSRAEIIAFLKASPDVGGVGTYPNGLIHADVADRKMAWHGRGGRAWPIGIDRVVSGGESLLASLPSLTPSVPSGGLAALLTAAITSAQPAPPSASAPETSPDEAAKPVAGRVPLPPRRPAILLAAVATSPSATEPTGPTDFAAVLRGPLAPSEPVPLRHVAAMEIASAATLNGTRKLPVLTKMAEVAE